MTAGCLRSSTRSATRLCCGSSDSLHEALPVVIHRLRAVLDLDADPHAINNVLHASFPARRRLACSRRDERLRTRRARGARPADHGGRGAHARAAPGRPLRRADGHAVSAAHAAVSAARCAGAAEGDALGQLGIVRQRQAAIVGIARAVADERLQLHGGADVQATLEALKQLPGIGDWTAQYIAMRALRWPDAFPAGDVALHKALGVQGGRQPGACGRSRVRKRGSPGAAMPWCAAWHAMTLPAGVPMKFDTSIVHARFHSPAGPHDRSRPPRAAWPASGSRASAICPMLGVAAASRSIPCCARRCSSSTTISPARARAFDLPLDLQAAPPSSRSVWQALLSIPHGRDHQLSRALASGSASPLRCARSARPSDATR